MKVDRKLTVKMSRRTFKLVEEASDFIVSQGLPRLNLAGTASMVLVAALESWKRGQGEWFPVTDDWNISEGEAK